MISAGANKTYRHPYPEAVDAHEEATSHKDVHCTNLHSTIRIYGKKDGKFQVRRQVKDNGSCAFGVQ